MKKILLATAILLSAAAMHGSASNNKLGFIKEPEYDFLTFHNKSGSDILLSVAPRLERGRLTFIKNEGQLLLFLPQQRSEEKDLRPVFIYADNPGIPMKYKDTFSTSTWNEVDISSLFLIDNTGSIYLGPPITKGQTITLMPRNINKLSIVNVNGGSSTVTLRHLYPSDFHPFKQPHAGVSTAQQEQVIKILQKAHNELKEELETLVNIFNYILINFDEIYPDTDSENRGRYPAIKNALGSYLLGLRHFIPTLSTDKSQETLKNAAESLTTIFHEDKNRSLKIFGEQKKIGGLIEPALEIIRKALDDIEQLNNPTIAMPVACSSVPIAPSSNVSNMRPAYLAQQARPERIQISSRESVAVDAENRLQNQLSGIMGIITKDSSTKPRLIQRLNMLKNILQNSSVDALKKLETTANVLAFIIEHYGADKIDYFGDKITIEQLLEEAKKIVLIALVELSEYESSAEERSKSVNPPLSEDASQSSEIPGMPIASSREPYNIIELPKKPEREESQPESSMPDEQEPKVPQPIIIPQSEAVAPAPAIIIPQAPPFDSTSTNAAPSSSVVRPTSLLSQIKGGTSLRKTTPQKRVAECGGLNAMFKNAAAILSKVKPLAEEAEEDDDEDKWASILNNSLDRRDLSREDDLLRPFMGDGALAPQKNTELSPLAQQALAQALMSKRRALEIVSDDEEDWSEED